MLSMFKGWLTPSYADKGDELFPGVTKPTTTLAHMIAAEIVKDSFNIHEGTNRFTVKGLEFSISRTQDHLFTLPNGKRYRYSLVKQACREYSLFTGHGGEYWQPGEIGRFSTLAEGVQKILKHHDSVKEENLKPTITIETKSVAFDHEEQKIIVAGIETAIKLSKERAAAQKIADNQNAALNIIETQFLSLKKEKVAPCDAQEGEAQCSSSTETPASPESRLLSPVQNLPRKSSALRP